MHMTQEQIDLAIAIENEVRPLKEEVAKLKKDIENLNKHNHFHVGEHNAERLNMDWLKH